MHRERCAGLGTSRNTGKNKGDEDEYGKIAHEDRFGWQHNRFVLVPWQTRFQGMHLHGITTDECFGECQMHSLLKGQGKRPQRCECNHLKIYNLKA
jgi:hypothetical protein